MKRAQACDTALPRGTAAVGRRVQLLWRDEKPPTWFEGVVKQFNETSGEHLVVYEDGDQRWHILDDEAGEDNLKWLSGAASKRVKGESKPAVRGEAKRATPKLAKRATPKLAATKAERPSASAKTPEAEVVKREPCDNMSVKLEGNLFTVQLNDGEVQLRKDWAVNFFEASCWQAQLCHGRFVEKVEVERLEGRKCHFFRELDRHTLYYVRARCQLLAKMRGIEVQAGHDFGELSEEEAQAVVLSTVLFRMYNRLGTFVRWALLTKYVKKPASAAPAAWRAALTQLTPEDVAELQRAQKKLAHGVEPGPSLAAAVPPSHVEGFLNFVEGVMDCCGVVHGDTDKIKCFTGEHQVQGTVKTRTAVEALMRSGLPTLVRKLRSADSAQEACELLKLPHAGPFLQYQFYLDLIEPHHSVFRGHADKMVKRGRFEHAQFGSGSLNGASLVAHGKKGALKGAQAGALRVARALVILGNSSYGHGAEWTSALEGLCPLPGAAGHTAGGGLCWDMQAVENKLCGIHGAKTAAEVVVKAKRIKKIEKGEKVWRPNPCTALEYDELYGA